MARDAPDGLVLLGRAFALQQAGRLADAEALYAQVLAATPDDATALVNGGAVALARADLPLALARFQRAARLAPGNAPARNNLGYALLRAGRASEALAVLDAALALAGNYAQAHNNRGIALAELNRPQEALAAFERALALEPNHLEAAQNLGEQCNAAGDGARAAAAFDRVLAAHPQLTPARAGRALAQALQGDLRGAIAALEAVTAADRSDAAAWQTLGAVRNWAWDHAGAEDAFRHALVLQPADTDAQFGIASTLLARGSYAEGWSAFDRRPDRAAESGAAFAALPVWDGAAFHGTLVVHGEQGFGDVVQFARFVAAARARVDELVLLVDGYRAPLAPLLRSVAGADAVVADAGDLEATGDVRRISILSLPQRLRIDADRIGAGLRYLAPPADRAAEWAARIAAIPAPRVGLAWSVLSRDTHGFVTRHKSVPTAVLVPVVRMPGVSFVSLQPGAAGDPAGFGADAACVIDLRAHIGDFADTAALIDALDLVVTADTAVAHVAGALGKPVFLLDRFNSCWRWRPESAMSPWYPTLRIFRQERFGDWDSVARALVPALAQWRRELAAAAGTC
ncbi:MAG: tetratricopeptide repeat protein [Betaproteobacteria bacterium]